MTSAPTHQDLRTFIQTYRDPRTRLDVQPRGLADDVARVAYANLLADAEMSAAEASRRAGLERRTAWRWLANGESISSDRLAALLQVVGGQISIPADARHLRLERARTRGF